MNCHRNCAAPGAAAFKPKGNQFSRFPEDTAPSHVAGSIEMEDLNADGKAEALIMVSSTCCYGDTESAFVLRTKDTKSIWHIILNQVVNAVTQTTSRKTWPEVEGPGPFPTLRYDGRK